MPESPSMMDKSTYLPLLLPRQSQHTSNNFNAPTWLQAYVTKLGTKLGYRNTINKIIYLYFIDVGYWGLCCYLFQMLWTSIAFFFSAIFSNMLSLRFCCSHLFVISWSPMSQMDFTSSENHIPRDSPLSGTHFPSFASYIFVCEFVMYKII